MQLFRPYCLKSFKRMVKAGLGPIILAIQEAKEEHSTF